MPKKQQGPDGYTLLTESLKAGKIKTFYIFHGDERYLLERGIGSLRERLCPDGLNGFNYRRYEGKSLSVDELEDAIDTLPVFAERTLIEVYDFDIFKHEQKQILANVLGNLPDYVCIVFVYDVIVFKPDNRIKLDAEIVKKADVLEFIIQDQKKLTAWIQKHFIDAGKQISQADAAYMAYITGGQMSAMLGEIEKAAAFAKEAVVSRADIDAVVIPVLDAEAYKLVDAIARNDHVGALHILDRLFQMREPPHKLIFSISLKMRQILAARICIDNGAGKNTLIDMCGIKYDFQATSLLDTARKMTLAECSDAVLQCARAALDLNSLPEPESRVTELIAKLAFARVESRK